MSHDRADDDLLHRHLNGDLDAREEADFLARVAGSPELRRTLAVRAMDDALLAEVVREGRVRVPVRSRSGWPAVAAAALMLAGLGFLLYPRSAPVAPREEKSPVVSDDQKKVDEAVRRACRFLESRKRDFFVPLADGKRHHAAPVRTYAELAALALTRAGYSPSDPLVEELKGRALGRPLESTYVASLRASFLSESDPWGNRDGLQYCAQVLVDSQCANGQWDYGRDVFIKHIPPGTIRRHQDGPPSGDNSATAYALQGLLACARAKVVVEPDVLTRARAWWLSCQNPDGGWGYGEFGKIDQSGADKRALTSNSSYGSMTASGVASLAALREMLGSDPASDAAVARGVSWLASNFSAELNPKKSEGFSHLHWLAASSRAAVLLGADRFGAHDWYAEGAAFLLTRQKPGGEWAIEGEFMAAEKAEIIDTCLAILFLTRKG